MLYGCQALDRVARQCDRNIILDVKKGSIILFYFCRSMRDLHYLHDLYRCTLMSSPEKLWKKSLSPCWTLETCTDLRISTMQWSSSDYNTCVRNLRALAELSPPLRLHGSDTKNWRIVHRYSLKYLRHKDVQAWTRRWYWNRPHGQNIHTSVTQAYHVDFRTTFDCRWS